MQHRAIQALALVATSVYALQSHHWAKNVLNRLYGVNPDVFEYTSTRLAALYSPVGVLYKNLIFVATPLRNAAIALIAVPLILLVLCIFLKKIRRKLPKAKLGYAIFALATFSAFLNAIQIEYVILNPLVELIAMEGDFRHYHRCNGPISRQANVVLFLGDNQVLAVDLTAMAPLEQMFQDPAQRGKFTKELDNLMAKDPTVPVGAMFKYLVVPCLVDAANEGSSQELDAPTLPSANAPLFMPPHFEPAPPRMKLRPQS